MLQMESHISIPIIILTLKIYSLICFAQESSINTGDSLSNSDLDFERLQDSNLGKRVFGYLSEYKRRPVYGFGLGKRSSESYNFGLSKRFKVDESSDDSDEYDEYSYNDGDDGISELELYHDDIMQKMDKRQKLYSSGPGKHLGKFEFGLGKRGEASKYGFSLGERSQPVLSHEKLYGTGLGKRLQSIFSNEKLYGTGLGKKNRPHTFGLQKRSYNQNAASGRFNFGLGKRSENVDFSKSIIAKRETHQENLSEATVYNPAIDLKTPASELQKFSNSAPEKHEIIKRSPYKYPYESEKPVLRTNLGFSRQFRRPSYTFGLGKRAPFLNKLAN